MFPRYSLTLTGLKCSATNFEYCYVITIT
uniref:Uncharacterized protein n=1 Tax=Arundo donax TaxID=35708 RepID=A0A0A9A962_ARUDO